VIGRSLASTKTAISRKNGTLSAYPFGETVAAE